MTSLLRTRTLSLVVAMLYAGAVRAQVPSMAMTPCSQAQFEQQSNILWAACNGVLPNGFNFQMTYCLVNAAGEVHSEARCWLDA
jgi:predicted membrane protein